jgi:hypothetical protein
MPSLIAPPAPQLPGRQAPSALDRLVDEIAPARDRLIAHPLYGRITSPAQLRRFMEMHVWAVWDFQSLLKAMQQKLTCTTVPWIPSPDPEARRLVNEIVLDEESDLLPDGSSASHFELYLDSMERAGADTQAICRTVDLLRNGSSLDQALAASGGHPGAIDFVRKSFTVINSGSPHQIVAAFTFGREDVIPDMFRHLVVRLAESDPLTWGRFRFYLERHIEHDDEKHAPLCRQIVTRMCGNDAAKWREATDTARNCLEARIALWDAIAASV